MSKGKISEEWKYPNLPPRQFQFDRTPSHLDSQDPSSTLNQSQLRGFLNMGLIFGIIFFVTQPIINFIDHGYFLESTLYNTFKVDLIFCVVNWPLFFLWSFTSFFLQLLVVKGLSPWIASILQHLTQGGLFIYSTYIILNNNWCSTHSAFVILQACSHFMKMHSYVTVNRDYREDYELAKKEGRKPLSNYPDNVNIKDFCLFMITPWLVYANYPRRSTINYFYAIKKFSFAMLLLITLYMIHSQFLQPWVHQAGNITSVELILRLMLPMTIFLVVVFYLVFQLNCNFFAQLSRLDSREFYEDWWNSTTYEEFNRKWNKPVHLFLYRHVYLEVIIRWKKSKMLAQAVTFLFSAFLHQFLLAIIFRTVKPIFLGFILFQIPLIKITRSMKNKRSGLYLTWFGLIFGPSLIFTCYFILDEKVTLMFAKKMILEDQLDM